ncbi:MAG: hypothetical protein ACJ0P5_04400 [Flavobacteriaceae bacterium]
MIKKNNSLDKINVVGDRVLVKPRKESEKTDSGLYLPPGRKRKRESSIWIYCKIWTRISYSCCY